MLNIEVVKCSGTDHKLKCLNEVVEAVRRARFGNQELNGRKVTIRGAITDPCGCHLDALIWMASDMAYTFSTHEVVLGRATMETYGRVARNEMH